MQEIHVFTSAAFNYIPKVRMLFNSLRKHHPEWRLHLVLADEFRSSVNLAHEPFDELHPITELGIPAWQGWAFCHTIVELATAIKPFMLMKLLNRPNTEKVIYLDPDIVVFSKLDDIIDALETSSVVLTPHQIVPEQRLDAVIDNEICSLKHGIYNLGFVGVCANTVGRDFAQWWSQRVYHFCRADIPNGLFTDQRWIDLAPALFPDIGILRSSRFNVAPWNITTRLLAIDATDQYTVDDQVLGFYHFTGFDSGAHQIMATKNGRNNPAVQKLIDWYHQETAHLAKDPLAKEAWGFSAFSDGTPVQKMQRLVYRERVDLQRQFPNPFDANGYLAWWNTRVQIEYPKLCNRKTEAEGMQEILSVLTPGFLGEALDNSAQMSSAALVTQAIANPQFGLQLVGRAWNILRLEGMRGLKRKIACRLT